MPISHFFRERAQAYADNTVATLLIFGASVAGAWLVNYFGPILGLDARVAMALAWLIALVIAIALSLLLKPKRKSETEEKNPPNPPQQTQTQTQSGIINAPRFENNPRFEFNPKIEIHSGSGATAATTKPPPNLLLKDIEPTLLRVPTPDEVIFRVASNSDSDVAPALVTSFCNELDRNREVGSINGVMARLLIRGLHANSDYTIDHGFWLDEKYQKTNFPVGTTRTLLIGFIDGKDDKQRPMFKVYQNNCESEKRNNKPNYLHFSGHEQLFITIRLFNERGFVRECELSLGLASDLITPHVIRPLS